MQVNRFQCFFFFSESFFADPHTTRSPIQTPRTPITRRVAYAVVVDLINPGGAGAGGGGEGGGGDGRRSLRRQLSSPR